MREINKEITEQEKRNEQAMVNRCMAIRRNLEAKARDGAGRIHCLCAEE